MYCAILFINLHHVPTQCCVWRILDFIGRFDNDNIIYYLFAILFLVLNFIRNNRQSRSFNSHVTCVCISQASRFSLALLFTLGFLVKPMTMISYGLGSLLPDVLGDFRTYLIRIAFYTLIIIFDMTIVITYSTRLFMTLFSQIRTWFAFLRYTLYFSHNLFCLFKLYKFMQYSHTLFCLSML